MIFFFFFFPASTFSDTWVGQHFTVLSFPSSTKKIFYEQIFFHKSNEIKEKNNQTLQYTVNDTYFATCIFFGIWIFACLCVYIIANVIQINATYILWKIQLYWYSDRRRYSEKSREELGICFYLKTPKLFFIILSNQEFNETILTNWNKWYSSSACSFVVSQNFYLTRSEISIIFTVISPCSTLPL